MEEERLNHLLRGLPREPAPEGFTSLVLRRLDEPARAKPARQPDPLGWHRLMLATATVAALGVSVSVGLLQREHSPGAVGAARTAAGSRDPARAAGGRLAAYPSERALIRGAVASPADGFAGRDREIGFSGPRPAAGGPGSELGGNGKRLSSVQAHLLLREMQLERGRLERELQSLRRADRGTRTPPTVLYLGGDENVDLVLSTGHGRALGALGRPAPERDGGDFNNFLD